MRFWISVFLLIATIACSTPDALKVKATNQDSLSKPQVITIELVRDWRARWTKPDTSLLLDPNVTALLPDAEAANQQRETIRLAESGLLRARILRQITGLTIRSNTATARLFTDSATPPYGLFAGTGELITLKATAQAGWRVVEVKTFLNDDYSTAADRNFFDLPSPKF
jgi:hypothetical protein